MNDPISDALDLLGGMAPALVGLCLVAVVSTPVLAPSTASLDNEDPQSFSTFATTAVETGYEVRSSVISPTEATGWSEDTTLVVVPDTASGLLPPTARELSTWRDDGGALWVADGRGGAIPLLRTMEIPVGQTRILDASLSGEPTEAPADVSIDGQTYRLVLEQPFVIDRDTLDDTAWTPVAETLDSSFVDLNGNDRLDTGDPRGPFVVGVEDEGRAIAFTSGHLLSNEALSEEETAAAVRTLTGSLLPEGGTIVVDSSHADHGPMGQAALAVLRPTVGVIANPLWGTLALLALAGGAGLTLYLRSERVGDWAAKRGDPHDISREGPPLDVDFMSKVLDSMIEESGSGSSPDRYRTLLDAIRDTETTNGSPEG